MCSLGHLGQRLGNLLGVAAVVAQQAAVALVISQGERAVDALHALAAGAAGDEAGKAAPIEQHDGLLAVLQALAQRFEQLARECGLLARLQKLLAHVDQFHRRHAAALRCGRATPSSVYLPRSAL